METLFIGIVVSLLVQGLKKYFATDPYTTMCIVAVLSLAGAGLYVWLTNAGLWQSFLPVLTASGAFYTFIIQRFQNSGNVVNNGITYP